MREQVIGIGQPQEWAAALADVPHGFHHTWACCHAAHLNSGLPTYLYRAESGGVSVVCPFSERRRFGALDLVTPLGFSGFAANGVWPGFARQWRAFASARGAVCGYFAQHPEFGHAEHEGPASGAADLYILDLREGAAAALAGARKGRRRELRVWRERGNAYIHDPERLTAFMLQHHAAFMQRVGASAGARLSDAALRQLIDAPGALLVGAGRDETVIDAVLLCGATAWGGEGVFNIGTPQGRQHTVALLAWGVEALSARGVPWFNLGGGVREGDALVNAKREWRPRVAAFRRLKQVYEPLEYSRLCARVGVSPQVHPAGYFPAYYAAGESASAWS